VFCSKDIHDLIVSYQKQSKIGSFGAPVFGEWNPKFWMCKSGSLPVVAKFGLVPFGHLRGEVVEKETNDKK